MHNLSKNEFEYVVKQLENELTFYKEVGALCEKITITSSNKRVSQLMIEVAFNRCLVEEKLRGIKNAEN